MVALQPTQYPLEADSSDSDRQTACWEQSADDDEASWMCVYVKGSRGPLFWANVNT